MSNNTEIEGGKSRCHSLSKVSNLNLWGNNLTDVSILNQMPNLKVLSLSVNKVFTLKDIQNCHKLEELYLRKNNIQFLKEIAFLKNLKNLKVLWLSENPCHKEEDYRLKVLGTLTNLRKLDAKDVEEKERQLALQKYKDFYSHQNEPEEKPPKNNVSQPKEEVKKVNSIENLMRYQPSSSFVHKHEKRNQPLNREPVTVKNVESPEKNEPKNLELSKSQLNNEEELEESNFFLDLPSPPKGMNPVDKAARNIEELQNSKYDDIDSFPIPFLSPPGERNGIRWETPIKEVSELPSFKRSDDRDDLKIERDALLRVSERLTRTIESLKLKNMKQEELLNVKEEMFKLSKMKLSQSQNKTKKTNKNIVAAILNLVNDLDYESLGIIENEVRNLKVLMHVQNSKK